MENNQINYVSKKGIHVPKDVKEYVLKKVRESGKTVPEIAKEQGIGRGAIYKWLRNETSESNDPELFKLKKENKSKALEYLNIARSTFYYQSVLNEKDEALRIKIESVMADNQSYGHKRIAIELGLGKKQVRRVMKKFGLEPSHKHKKPWKRAAGEESTSSPNLLVALLPLYRHQIGRAHV